MIERRADIGSRVRALDDESSLADGFSVQLTRRCRKFAISTTPRR